MKRLTDYLLDAIWTEEAAPIHPEDYTQLHRRLDALLPFSKVFLSVSESMLDGCVFSDDVEVMPALPLGDVLAEEFEINVPYGTVVICCTNKPARKTDPLKDFSATMGEICAEVIVDAVQLGGYRLDRESEALGSLGCLMALQATASDTPNGKLKDAEFRAAFARKVATLTGVKTTVEAGMRADTGTPRHAEIMSVSAQLSKIATTRHVQAWRDALQSLLLKIEPGIVMRTAIADPNSTRHKV